MNITSFPTPVSFCRGHATYKSPCRSVGRSVRPSHFTFFAFLGILRVGKSVFEHAPAQIITAPAQIITAPAQVITAPAQPPATGAVVYTALLFCRDPFLTKDHRFRRRKDPPVEMTFLKSLLSLFSSRRQFTQRIKHGVHSYIDSTGCRERLWHRQ